MTTTARIRYRSLPCLLRQDGRCAGAVVFAHYPKHRGMGGAGAGWQPHEGLPLCRYHHDALDARGPTWAEHERVRQLVADLAPAFWKQTAKVVTA